jgi:SAM-dependent methyltransferase
MSTKTFDQAKAEAFTYKMMNILNSGALSLMISIGHRTGLFDVMSTLPPSTSEDIASTAKLNERYVREWLGAVTTGGIIVYDEIAGTYTLPAEHAAFLTREASPENIAVTCQYMGILGSVEDKIVECFRSGGGVPYKEFHRFHQVMAEESAQTTVAGLTGGIIPLVPGLDEMLKKGITVLDVGCGSGRAINFLAERYPGSRFVGYDFSHEAIANAWAEALKKDLSNVHFEVRDVASLGKDRRFDLILAFDAIHDQAHPDRVLSEISRVLNPNGLFLMQDIMASSHVHKNLDLPMAPFIYTISCMHCMTVSLALDGHGLGAAWGCEKACDMLREAGFQSIAVHQLDHDIQNYYYVAALSEETIFETGSPEKKKAAA